MMNTLLKRWGLGVLIILGAGTGVWGGDLETLQKRVETFSGDVAGALPFNAAIGLNWSDAYIGKIFPGLPPHFGIGGSLGFTAMKMDAVEALSGYLGYDGVPFTAGRMFLPVYAAEARIGGIFLPFDIGVKFGILPAADLWDSSTRMNYTLLGGELRYAVLDGKTNPLVPNISVSAGLNYLKGGIGGAAATQTFTYGGSPGSVKIDNPEADLYWETKALDFKVQISKSFLVITPYAGIGGGYAWSKTGYRISASNISVSGSGFDAFADANGLDLRGNELSSEIEKNGFNVRVFGGFALNFVVFRLDFTGMFNFPDSTYGGSLGLRFQL
jgi:hypothetical protein